MYIKRYIERMSVISALQEKQATFMLCTMRQYYQQWLENVHYWAHSPSPKEMSALAHWRTPN